MSHLLEQRLLLQGYLLEAGHVLASDVCGRTPKDLSQDGVTDVCSSRLRVDKAVELQFDDVVDLCLRKRLHHD